jgi:hypothetical protein
MALALDGLPDHLVVTCGGYMGLKPAHGAATSG